MHEFTAKYAGQIAGVLNGFDRLVLRGTLRQISYSFGLQGYLWANQVLLKDFGPHVQKVSEQVKTAALEGMKAADRPILYLPSSREDKDETAHKIARQDGIESGPVCALTCVEPCWSFDVHRNRETKQLDLVQRSRKCLFVYQYWQHPEWGWMNARIQTWFPFSIQICLNGREWLARQMQQQAIGFQKQGNCFVWIDDWAGAQRLLDEQMKTDWPQMLDGIARGLNPQHEEMFARLPLDYYWSVYQSEWASDVVFHKADDLRRLFPIWLRHAILTFQSADILKFLGKTVTREGEVPGTVQVDVTSSMKRRQPGARIKHWYGENSLKAYDKAYSTAGSTLRAEMTMQNPEDFKVYRHPESEPDKPMRWYRLRKGVADLQRRAEICQKTNERYLDALAAVDSSQTLAELIDEIQRPTCWQGKRNRSLHPFGEPDVSLLAAISRGDFLLNGLRNRDLQKLLYADLPATANQHRQRSAAVGRRLRLLRAHRIIRKVPKTHRYHVTEFGRQILPAVSSVRHVTVKSLNAKAA